MNSKYGMIGLIFIGICMIVAVNRYKSYDRSVSVKGLCEKEVMADKVIWPLVYKIVGNNMEAIYKEATASNNIGNSLKSPFIIIFTLNIGVGRPIKATQPKVTPCARMHAWY